MGQPRGAVAANGRQGAREFRVGFPLSAHELLVARARQTGRGEKKKKKSEKVHAQARRDGGKVIRLVKRSEEEGARKKKEKSDEFASRCPPRTRERANERNEKEEVRKGEERREREREGKCRMREPLRRRAVV